MRNWSTVVIICVVLMGLLNDCPLVTHSTAEEAMQHPAEPTGAQKQHPDVSVIILRSGEDPRPVFAPGQKFTLKIGVDNLKGQADAHSTTLTVRLPTGLTLNSAEATPDKVDNGAEGTTLVWNLGTLKARSFPRLVHLDLTVATAVAVPSQISLSAQAVSSEPNVTPAHQNAVMTLYIHAPAADLRIESDLDAVALTAGQPSDFNAEVSNDGNVTASAVNLQITVPSGVVLKSGQPKPTTSNANLLSWQLGDIAPGSSSLIEITVVVNSSLPPIPAGEPPDPKNLLKFKFDASTTAVQTNPEHAHLTVIKAVELAGPDLKIWLMSDAEQPIPLLPEKDVTFTVRYGNVGNRPASNVTAVLNLSEGLRFKQADPPPTHLTKSDRFPGGILSWTIGDLRPGDANQITSRVHIASVPEYGSFVMATISSPETDINPANNAAFFYGYPPALAGAQGGFGSAVGSGHKEAFGMIGPGLLTIALIAGVWLILREIRHHRMRP